MGKDKFIKNVMRAGTIFVIMIMLLFALIANAIAIPLIPAPPAFAETTYTYNTAGTYSWTVPTGVTSVTVEVWGGGGRGGRRANSIGGGGGGGGGAYSRADVTVTPGNSYTVFVGAGSSTIAAGGDSYFINTSTVMAKGGNSCPNNNATGAAGGSADSGVGDTKYSGGNGANGVAGSYGGGGGSSAGTGQDGNNGTGSTGGAAPSGGGAGGNGRSGTQGGGSVGQPPGGGGGGALRTSTGNAKGGSGAAGRVRITYEYGGTTTSIDITAPDDIADWPLDPTIDEGENTTGGTLAVYVTPYDTTWSVTAKDMDATTGGYMTEWSGSAYGTAKLLNPLRVQGPAAEVTLPNNAGIDIVTGSGNTSNINITFKQMVTWDDEPGTYKIVITFIGTIN